MGRKSGWVKGHPLRKRIWRGEMSCDNKDLNLEALENIKYSSTLGTFVGKFIGELIDKLRIEEEMRSELELRLAQKNMD